MDKNTLIITVNFKCPLEVYDLADPFMQNYLARSHQFTVKTDAVLRDLLIAILQEIDLNNEYQWDDNYLYSRFTGYIDNQETDLNFNYPVKDFVLYNSVEGAITLNYHVFLRGGWGVSLTADIRLVMPSKETGHEKTPHVHVRKGKYLKHDSNRNTVRVKLSDLSVMDNAERKAIKLFGKDDWNYIIKTIEFNQSWLIDNYYLMLKGAMPECIMLNLDEHQSSVMPNRFQLLEND